MIHAILIIAAILGCLALFGALTYLFADPHWKAAIRYTAWRWYRLVAVRQRRVRDCWKLSDGKRRCRRGSAGLPDLDHILPYLRRKLAEPQAPARHSGVPIADVDAQHATRAGLLDRRPRNGALLPDRLRDTPEPFPFRVPPYYAAYEAEKRGDRP